jgi:hypothetical protein
MFRRGGAGQGCWEAFCGTGGTGLFQCRFLRKRLYSQNSELIAHFSPAKAGFTAGQSSCTAVPGRQHNCLPFALAQVSLPTKLGVLVWLGMVAPVAAGLWLPAHGEVHAEARGLLHVRWGRVKGC